MREALPHNPPHPDDLISTTVAKQRKAQIRTRKTPSSRFCLRKKAAAVTRGRPSRARSTTSSR